MKDNVRQLPDSVFMKNKMNRGGLTAEEEEKLGLYEEIDDLSREAERLSAHNIIMNSTLFQILLLVNDDESDLGKKIRARISQMKIQLEVADEKAKGEAELADLI